MSEKKKRGRPRKKMDITIPETLDEISLGQFQRFHKATDGEKDVDTVNKLALNIFFGIPIKDFERVKARDVHTLVAMLNKALTTPPKLKMRFEMNGVEENIAREALRRAGHKLPVKCKIIKAHK